MGLDNGIMLKIKNREKFGNVVPFLKHQDWEDKDEYEILYWRKCWNIREEIFTMLHTLKPEDNGNCVFSVELLEDIIYHLNECYTPEWWRDHNNSIWDFDEVCGNYYYHLINAIRVVDFLKTRDPESYEIYFYDSY